MLLKKKKSTRQFRDKFSVIISLGTWLCSEGHDCTSGCVIILDICKCKQFDDSYTEKMLFPALQSPLVFVVSVCMH